MPNFNTRIALKYASYAEWKDSTLKLMPGEVAVVTVPADFGGAGSIAGIDFAVKNPTVLFKIGIGDIADESTWKTFAELPWASALASDVYAWAKGEKLAITVEGEGNVLSSVAWDANAGAIKFTTISVATSSDLAGLAARVKAIEDDYLVGADKEELQGGIDAAAKAAAAAQGTADANAEAIAAINHETNGILAQAKKYADDNDADTQYGIEYDSATRKIKLVSDTSKTEIDASAFIKDGMIDTVTLSEDGKSLVITWNADAGKEQSTTTIPLTALVDVYTGVDGSTVKVEVSADNKVSAEVKDGTIAEAKLTTELATKINGKEEAGVAQGLVDGLANGAVKGNTDAIATINDETTGILAQAKKYADDNDTDTTYTAAANSGLKLEGTEFSIDASQTFVFNCGGAN